MSEIPAQVVGMVLAAVMGAASALGVKWIDHPKVDAEAQATIASTYQGALQTLRDEMKRREEDFELRLLQHQAAHEQAMRRERAECDRRITALEREIAELRKTR